MQASLRRPIVAGNWKMNGSAELAETFVKGAQALSFSSVSVVICPPFPYLGHFVDARFGLGGQNAHHLAKGAQTGEVSAGMLKEVGCDYVILGHSERREMGESSELVADKVASALEVGLTPIFCVGEPLDVRQDNGHFEYVKAQLVPVIDKVGIAAFNEMVIAYEPVWAIGTGNTASPAQAQEVHAYIRSVLAGYDKTVAEGVAILYGGSVKASNAQELFSQADIDGGLIGGASLELNEFSKICQAADNLG